MRVLTGVGLAAAMLGCGKQEGALSPSQGSAQPATPPPATSLQRPVNPASDVDPSRVDPVKETSRDERYAGKEGDGSPDPNLVLGAAFFHGSWVSESGDVRRADRESRGSRRSKSGASSANVDGPPIRKRAPAIRQMLRSIVLSLGADGKIRLAANGGMQDGQYAVKPIDSQTMQITARFESGARAVTDVFKVRAQARDRWGRARMQVIVPGDEPMMLFEKVPKSSRR